MTGYLPVRFRLIIAALLIAVGSFSAPARATDTLCDPSFQNCRTPLLTLIQNEKVGIDVAFWFMQDARYESAIVSRWKAGVPVRILVDPRANPTYSGNSTMLDDFAAAGIPMRKRTASGILHWKMMLFAGQQAVEFGSANFSPNAFVPNSPYTDYVAETIYYTTDSAVVNSFKTKFDDSWVDTSSFANYSNIHTPLVRTYPKYSIDPELNFPPAQDFALRSLNAFSAETKKIDVIMYRITDSRHTNAMIAAVRRGVPVRLLAENKEYRDPQYLWDAWNVDLLYANGVKIRWRGHAGQNHEKLVLLYGQAMTIFGSSNWTSASAAKQQEHNYFTKKSAIFTWFENQFTRMWTNSKAAESTAFVPLPPDKPAYVSPATGSSVSSSTVNLKWYGGPWGVYYDVYFGTSSPPPLAAANLNLGPSTTPTSYQSWTTPTLKPGTTYYWEIVSKTNAGVKKAGAVGSFSTTGTPAASALPSGWSSRDIGSVGVSGSASYSNATFTVSGSGSDIWGTSDAFHYAYKTLTGDGQLVARVASVPESNAWSKAGVMIRASLSAGAAYAQMLVSAAKGTAFQYRTSTGASAANASGGSHAAPYWVKVVRSGSTVSGYQSSDGSSWTLVGHATVALGSTAYVGLAVTSHDNSRICSALFDHVS